MALHGDFSSFPLPELLQWLDGSRKTGTLQLLTWEGGERKLFLLSGQVLSVAHEGLWGRVARVLSLAKLADGAEVLAAFNAVPPGTEDVEPFFRKHNVELKLVRELVREEMLGSMVDQTRGGHGAFHWSEDLDRTGEEWGPCEMSLRELLFESLRWVDEQPDVDRVLPGDALTVRSRVQPTPRQPLMHRILLTMCAGGQNLGRLRLSLGLSRSATTRRVFELLRAKQVEVEGAPEVVVDPVTDMLEKGAVLIREGQYDAAELVCSSLLSSDPTDRRVREFARMVQSEHVASLYAKLPPLSVPVLRPDPETQTLLNQEERQVSALVNGSWDVSTLVLASSARELETLKTLAKLMRMGLLQMR
ncbi:DUF4388 domain-containing protein [Archangium violaceum]|uniref:PatA-like N-terminal domain-containing protein n=1 Tax=Archangium violaceum Cb vi76 TaxID=1406225 RepID=A0A084SNT6_9BACT|nr:DUF4388 domain-containing protein [Archangium violaceum]KFA90121.1 hypothetical protein Q664_30555 [Archangium violaceum Cb vi76]